MAISDREYAKAEFPPQSRTTREEYWDALTDGARKAGQEAGLDQDVIERYAEDIFHLVMWRKHPNDTEIALDVMRNEHPWP
jgi:hypothetical protein